MIKHTYEAMKAKWGKPKTDTFIIILGAILLLGFVSAINGWRGNNYPVISYSDGMAIPSVSVRMGGAVSAPMMAKEEYAYDQAITEGGYVPEMLQSMYPPVPVNPSSNIAGDIRHVIKNGSLEMIVKKAEDAVSGIEAIATKYKGFVDASNIYEVSEGVKAGTVTIRVPGEQFLSAMNDLRAIAIKVTRENIDSSDVTAQVVDLESRMKNLRAQEEQYRSIMSRAVKIEDVLAVSERLSSVRGQIEQIQGQINYLSRQVAMSSISILLTAEPEVKVFGVVWRPLTVIKQALRQVVYDVTNFVDNVIYFIASLPGLILQLAGILLVAWLLWKVLKFLKNKFFPSSTNQLN